jgi:hypothetical protein
MGARVEAHQKTKIGLQKIKRKSEQNRPTM